MDHLSSISSSQSDSRLICETEDQKTLICSNPSSQERSEVNECVSQEFERLTTVPSPSVGHLWRGASGEEGPRPKQEGHTVDNLMLSGIIVGGSFLIGGPFVGLGVGALFLAGCADSTAAGGADASTRCESDSECPQGQTCRAGNCEAPVDGSVANGEGRILLSDHMLNFGVALQGSETSLPLTVTNIGDGPLHVASINIEEDDMCTGCSPEYSADPQGEVDRTLNVGEPLSMTITFRACVAATVTGVLHIASDDPTMLTADVQLVSGFKCFDGLENCDGNPCNACETPINTPTDCGECGAVCSPLHDTPVCMAGACSLAACDAGWGDCDGDEADGCERPLDTADNCGDCGSTCATGASCVDGMCACPDTQIVCDEACIDVSSDPLNCGDCGVVCGASCYEGSCCPWVPMTASGGPAPRDGHTSVWTGSEMIIFGGRGIGEFGDGWGYNPVTDSWAILSGGTLGPRFFHTAVWTDSEMIIWGGFHTGGSLGNGARYNPATSSWTPMATAGAPTARSTHAAVFASDCNSAPGEQPCMIVWGGENETGYLGDGGRYDLAADAWMPVSTAGAPSPRSGFAAVWTGARMIVWGGSGDLNMGGRYDPINDTWSPTTTIGAPEGRTSSPGAVWTGSEMIVWGGQNGTSALNTGGRYDPALDTWSSTTIMGAPEPRYEPTAVWTGSEMIVWGGFDGSLGVDAEFDTGGRYNPVSDSWLSTESCLAPGPRFYHTAVWTDSAMIIFGGLQNDPAMVYSDGFRYVP